MTRADSADLILVPETTGTFSSNHELSHSFVWRKSSHIQYHIKITLWLSFLISGEVIVPCLSIYLLPVPPYAIDHSVLERECVSSM